MVKVFEVLIKFKVDVPEHLKESGGDIIEKGLFRTDKVDLVRWLQTAGHKITNVLDSEEDGKLETTELIWKGVEKVAEDVVNIEEADIVEEEPKKLVHKIKGIGTKEEIVEVVEEAVKEIEESVKEEIEEVAEVAAELIEGADVSWEEWEQKFVDLLNELEAKVQSKFATIDEVDTHFNKLSNLIDEKIEVVKETGFDIQPCADTAKLQTEVTAINKKLKSFNKSINNLAERISILEVPPNEPEPEPEPVPEVEKTSLDEAIETPVDPKEKIDEELLEKVEDIAKEG